MPKRIRKRDPVDTCINILPNTNVSRVHLQIFFTRNKQTRNDVGFSLSERERERSFFLSLFLLERREDGTR